jgi:hypothetical protein
MALHFAKNPILGACRPNVRLLTPVCILKSLHMRPSMLALGVESGSFFACRSAVTERMLSRQLQRVTEPSLPGGDRRDPRSGVRGNEPASPPASAGSKARRRKTVRVASARGPPTPSARACTERNRALPRGAGRALKSIVLDDCQRGEAMRGRVNVDGIIRRLAILMALTAGLVVTPIDGAMGTHCCV